MEKNETLFIVDVMGFVFRAYHALPPLTSPQGIPTGAVYGFCSMLFKLLDDFKPTYLAAALDTGQPTFRHQLYADYKANRPPPPEDLVEQFPWIEKVLTGFRVAALKTVGFEADDIIATLVSQAKAQSISCVIVSSDKDLMQLSCDTVSLLDTVKNKMSGPQEVLEKFAVKPAQLGDYLALVGDSSDNVPGVPGVGAKTAAKLLAEYGDLETILSRAQEVKGEKLKQSLLASAEKARLSRKLVALEENVPLSVSLSDLRQPQLDNESLKTIFSELGFSRFYQRVSSASPSKNEEKIETNLVPTSAASPIDRSLYRTVFTEAELQEVLAAIYAAGRCAVDLETTSLDIIKAQIVGVSLAWGAGQAAYIPVGHVYLGMPTQLGLATVLRALTGLLTDEKFPKYGQNFKYDWLVLKRAGIEMRGIICDTMLASYLLDPSRNSHGLDSLAADHLHHQMISFSEVAGPQKDFSAVEIDRATEYAAEDAEATLLLADHFAQRLSREPKLNKLLAEMELPLARLLGQMELDGVLIDGEQLRQMSSDLQVTLRQLEQDVQTEAGWEVNLNSPKQLQKLLFEDLGLTTGRKTKTGYSTDAEVLAELALENPIAAKIDEYRTLAKLKGTYLDTLPQLIRPETGRVHTSYNQAVTATGRLSSSDPNLQNIPARTKLGEQIRAAFIAPPDYLLLSADYSQIELRILAHLSQDEVLIESFRLDEDVHRRTAAEVFNVPTEEVTAEQRRVAKVVNFGVIYGQTEWGLAKQLGISPSVASSYIASYFMRYQGVKRYMEESIARAKEEGEVYTLYGRRRPLLELKSSQRTQRQYGERIARNTPIQGTAADIMKMAMLAVEKELRQRGLKSRMILSVHDEIVAEVSRSELAQVKELVPAAMSSVADLAVVLKVDVGIGENWAAAKGAA